MGKLRCRNLFRSGYGSRNSLLTLNLSGGSFGSDKGWGEVAVTYDVAINNAFVNSEVPVDTKRFFQKQSIIHTIALSLAILGSATSANAESARPTLHESKARQTGVVTQNCRDRGYSYTSGTRIVQCSGEMNSLGECEISCVHTRETGCFPPEAQIVMGDGTTKAIKRIRTGDLVWNPVRKKAFAVGAVFAGPEKNPLIEIGFGDKKITVTETHPLIVRATTEGSIKPVALVSEPNAKSEPDFRVKKANEVTKDDELLAQDGKFYRVEVLRQLPVQEGQIVYNFELLGESDQPADHTIVSAGIVTGDITAQYEVNGVRPDWK